MKNTNGQIAVFWFRRDLRLEDNSALSAALNSGLPVLPVFIFDEDILKEFSPDERRVSFIYKQLKKIHRKLDEWGSGLYCVRGKTMEIWDMLLHDYQIKAVYINRTTSPMHYEETMPLRPY